MDIAGSIHLLESTGWDLEVGIKINNFDVKKMIQQIFQTYTGSNSFKS